MIRDKSLAGAKFRKQQRSATAKNIVKSSCLTIVVTKYRIKYWYWCKLSLLQQEFGYLFISITKYHNKIELWTLQIK